MDGGSDDGVQAAPVAVADLVLRRAPSWGSSRLVCIDGPAGSGKTTLADRVADELRRRGHSVALVHMDDVYEGWTGLATAGDRVRTGVVEPLTRGRPAAYRRYDWAREEYAELVAVPPADVLVVEGVGAGHLGYTDRISVLVFVDAPEVTRMERGLRRDGPAMQDHWRRWLPEEERLLETERTRARADVLVDGETGRATVVRRRPG
jgi:uridine kinase